jgi:hypothetical protein
MATQNNDVIYTAEYVVEWTTTDWDHDNDRPRRDEWWIDIAVHDHGWRTVASVKSIDHTAEALSADDLRALAAKFTAAADFMDKLKAERMPK